MTDLPPPPAPLLSSRRPQREPYRKPCVQPLGQWAALTLVYSVPTGPGGAVFKKWSKT
ncbi:hypothetical protein Q0M94_12890 [Deinococcus radiomollis]|uniref:hypothetical protein n=1 Tax=Deinococcus radiomollis TaxID=468916 RepID=UPI0038922215